MNAAALSTSIQSTAGAVPVKNEKGNLIKVSDDSGANVL